MTDRSTTQEPPVQAPSSAQPVESEVRSLYTEQQKQAGLAYPTETTMFLNFGYWSPDCSSLDEACRTLAERLGDAAGITTGDRVLDAGFGFGDQDMHWMETRDPALIAGLNVTPAQVELARERVRKRKLDDRIDLRVGSATDMPFEAESFDRVVALESAFHFDTRQDFFREAARVLRPGGTLATADVILLAGGDREQRIREMGDCRSLVPEANWYDESTYIERLHEAGFTDVRVERITDNVYQPLLAFLRDHLRKTGQQDLTMDALVWGMRPFIAHTDYVLVSAAKPA